MRICYGDDDDNEDIILLKPIHDHLVLVECH